MSIDVDSVDLWLLHALVGEGSPYRPRIISIGYNANFAPDMLVSMEREWHAWTIKVSLWSSRWRNQLHYSNLQGYTPIYVMASKLDMFLLRDDILKKKCKHPPTFAHFPFVPGLPKRIYRLCHYDDLDRKSVV